MKTNVKEHSEHKLIKGVHGSGAQYIGEKENVVGLRSALHLPTNMCRIKLKRHTHTCSNYKRGVNADDRCARSPARECCDRGTYMN